MFESEYAVEIQDGPAKISLFADKSPVQERGDSFFLDPSGAPYTAPDGA